MEEKRRKHGSLDYRASTVSLGDGYLRVVVMISVLVMLVLL
jgi:hypothetical protein